MTMTMTMTRWRWENISKMAARNDRSRMEWKVANSYNIGMASREWLLDICKTFQEKAQNELRLNALLYEMWTSFKFVLMSRRRG